MNKNSIFSRLKRKYKDTTYSDHKFNVAVAKENGFVQSMSAKGCCYDNACAESFFSSLKKDKLYGRKFRSRNDAKTAIVEYVELFYSPRRLHSTLGYKSPKEYKRDYYSEQKIAA